MGAKCKISKAGTRVTFGVNHSGSIASKKEVFGSVANCNSSEFRDKIK